MNPGMRIARFLSAGKVLTGQWVDDRSARRVEGDLFGKYSVTDDVVVVEKLLAPIVPTDILCIGVNYRKHAEETGSPIPQTPMLFIKSSNTLNNPNDPIIAPKNSAMVDFEAELCVVIGKAARHVSEADALDYVFGYTCANDVSARDWQRDKSLGGGQFARGKSFDTFCPLGPWIVTKDEIADPNALRIRCELNGQTVQDSSTGDMIYNVRQLIASLSSTLTLKPGSVILTGTPEGVGMGRTPPLWMKGGDRVAVEIEKIGRLENRVVAEGA